MVFDRVYRVEDDPLSPIRKVWNDIKFDGMHPSVEELPRIADIVRYLIIRSLIFLLSVILILVSVWLVL